jgi:hypothetical protein
VHFGFGIVAFAFREEEEEARTWTPLIVQNVSLP